MAHVSDLIASDIGFRPGETLRVLIHADFIIDVKERPLDGNHIGGKLPSGNGAYFCSTRSASRRSSSRSARRPPSRSR